MALPRWFQRPFAKGNISFFIVPKKETETILKFEGIWVSRRFSFHVGWRGEMQRDCRPVYNKVLGETLRHSRSACEIVLELLSNCGHGVFSLCCCTYKIIFIWESLWDRDIAELVDGIAAWCARFQYFGLGENNKWEKDDFWFFYLFPGAQRESGKCCLSPTYFFLWLLSHRIEAEEVVW